MECWDFRELKNDLQRLVDIVDKYKIPCEVSQIHNLLGKFYEIRNFEYSLSNIVFKIDKKIAGSYPAMEEYEIFFDNTVISKLEKDINSDCVSDYKFEINIEGKLLHDDDVKPLKSCWHLDKHIESENGLDGVPKYTHPIYHFQFGGEYLLGCDTGDLGILANPRIPHPPMDIFLGFNFIINNFYNWHDYDFVKQLIEDDEYNQILKRAQERLWNPYFNAFDSTNTNTDFTIKRIFPLYIN